MLVTSKTLEGHIDFGLSVRLFVRSFIPHFDACHILWTKLAQIHHWDWEKKWLDFGDLDLIYKVTSAHWNSNFDRESLCAHCLLNQWLEFYQTSKIYH